MKMLDLVIVGAGMVGLALASALRESGLRIAVIDQKLPEAMTLEPSTRVSAINLASERFLTRTGAWPLLARKAIFAGLLLQFPRYGCRFRHRKIWRWPDSWK